MHFVSNAPAPKNHPANFAAPPTSTNHTPTEPFVHGWNAEFLEKFLARHPQFHASQKAIDEFFMVDVAPSEPNDILAIVKLLLQGEEGFDLPHLENRTSLLIKALKDVKVLDLSIQYLTDVHVQRLCEAMVSPSCCLEVLMLHGNAGIGLAGITALANMLRKNNTLTELELGWIHVQDTGAKVLADAIKHNRTLSHLGLAFSGIGDEGGKTLLTAIKYNGVLTNIDVSFNPELSEIVKAAIQSWLDQSAKIYSLGKNVFDCVRSKKLSNLTQLLPQYLKRLDELDRTLELHTNVPDLILSFLKNWGASEASFLKPTSRPATDLLAKVLTHAPIVNLTEDITEGINDYQLEMLVNAFNRTSTVEALNLRCIMGTDQKGFSVLCQYLGKKSALADLTLSIPRLNDRQAKQLITVVLNSRSLQKVDLNQCTNRAELPIASADVLQSFSRICKTNTKANSSDSWRSLPNFHIPRWNKRCHEFLFESSRWSTIGKTVIKNYIWYDDIPEDETLLAIADWLWCDDILVKVPFGTDRSELRAEFLQKIKVIRLSTWKNNGYLDLLCEVLKNAPQLQEVDLIALMECKEWCNGKYVQSMLDSLKGKIHLSSLALAIPSYASRTNAPFPAKDYCLSLQEIIKGRPLVSLKLRGITNHRALLDFNLVMGELATLSSLTQLSLIEIPWDSVYTGKLANIIQKNRGLKELTVDVYDGDKPYATLFNALQRSTLLTHLTLGFPMSNNTEWLSNFISVNRTITHLKILHPGESFTQASRRLMENALAKNPKITSLHIGNHTLSNTMLSALERNREVEEMDSGKFGPTVSSALTAIALLVPELPTEVIRVVIKNMFRINHVGAWAQFKQMINVAGKPNPDAAPMEIDRRVIGKGM